MTRSAHRKENPLHKLALLIGILEGELAFFVIVLAESTISKHLVQRPKRRACAR